MEKRVGEFCETQDVLLVSRFEWRIPLIKSYFQRDGDTCESPLYQFCDGVWALKVTKRGYCVDIQLNRQVKELNHKNDVECELIKISNVGEYSFAKDRCTAHERNWEKRLFVENRPRYLLNKPGDFDVKIVCLLNCFECKSADREALSKCFDSVGKDLLDLFISGEDSDVTIKVKNRVFNVHKNIIKARSSTFFWMLYRDMVKNKSKTVVITDCNPEAFQLFLEYMYTGKMKSCSKDILSSLYYIAAKYRALEAKAECIKLLPEILSVENFCDTAACFLRHKNTELLEIVNQFFVDNSQAIIQTEQWRAFLKQNPVAANDFLIKLLAPDLYLERKKN